MKYIFLSQTRQDETFFFATWISNYTQTTESKWERSSTSMTFSSLARRRASTELKRESVSGELLMFCSAMRCFKVQAQQHFPRLGELGVARCVKIFRFNFIEHFQHISHEDNEKLRSAHVAAAHKSHNCCTVQLSRTSIQMGNIWNMPIWYATRCKLSFTHNSLLESLCSVNSLLRSNRLHMTHERYSHLTNMTLPVCVYVNLLIFISSATASLFSTGWDIDPICYSPNVEETWLWSRWHR